MTRSDVVVKGEAVLAAEVQQTGIELREVLRRSRAAVKAGATPTWFADEKDPPWAFRVPHVETNKRLGMAPGTWTVATGPRVLESERCEPGARVDCIRGPGWCGRSHLLWVPMPGVTVDAVVEMVPAGGLVRVETGTRQGTILASPRDQEAWLEEYPPDDHDEIKMPTQRGASDGRIRHPDYSPRKLRARLERTVRRSEESFETSEVARERPAALDGAPTVLDRLLAAGISESRARLHLAAGRIQMDGIVVTDSGQLAPPPARIVIAN